jgi:hypothetical protein
MPEPEPPPLEAILQRVGISSSGIDRIKFGKGVVGKLATMQMGLYVVCVTVVLSAIFLREPWLAVGGIATAICSHIFSSVLSVWFAERNQAIALLEGAELVQYRQMEMAAKDLQVPVSQPNIEAPPLLVPPEALADG